MTRKEPIERFLEFLSIRTVSGEGPEGSYQQCVEWLRDYLAEDGLTSEILYPVEKKPILLSTWKGEDSSLPGILLNSHYDVVPAMPEHWDNEPFKAKVLDDGFIHGRGTQDMKCVCIQYVEAVHELKQRGFVPKRDIHLLFVPDEEIGGVEGMNEFVKTEAFQKLQPIAFAFDEGLANPNDAYTVFYGERAPWWIYVKAEGATGHGSRFIKGMATEKIVNICNKALTFREEQEKLLTADVGCKHGDMKKKKLGDVTTINLTVMQSGVTSNGGKTYAMNVIPTQAMAGFDVRIPPSTNLDDFKNLLDQWCAEEEGVSWEYAPQTVAMHKHYLTSLDESNVFWTLFEKSCQKLGKPIEKEVFPASTDSRYLRQLQVPAIGFSPMDNTEILLHEHNERLHKDIFLRGLQAYVTIFEDMFSHA